MSIITLNSAYYGEYESHNDFNEVGKKVTFLVDVYSNYECYVFIYTYVGQYTHSSVWIPANTPGTYSVTRTIPQNADHIVYRVEPRGWAQEDSFTYMDNWRLTIVEE